MGVSDEGGGQSEELNQAHGINETTDIADGAASDPLEGDVVTKVSSIFCHGIFLISISSRVGQLESQVGLSTRMS